jgi:hypothetical protein
VKCSGLEDGQLIERVLALRVPGFNPHHLKKIFKKTDLVGFLAFPFFSYLKGGSREIIIASLLLIIELMSSNSAQHTLLNSQCELLLASGGGELVCHHHFAVKELTPRG